MDYWTVIIKSNPSTCHINISAESEQEAKENATRIFRDNFGIEEVISKVTAIKKEIL